MKRPDLLAAAEPVAEAFEKLGIPYYIGGSLASSAYGLARSTMDVDMVADLGPKHARPLVEMLESSYYIDEGMILEAIRNRSSFNMIDLETMFKIDIFITRNSPHDIETFKRRRRETLHEEQCAARFYLASAEDVVLNKMACFRLGADASDRQWHDILGVFKVQQESLDMMYLRHWASELNVQDLLERAVRDAGLAN